MSTAAHSLVPTQRSRIQTIKWAMGHADTVGDAVEMSFLQDRTVHVYGVFDSATVVIQGSNDPLAITSPGTADWQTLRDPGGTALSFTSAGLKAILELPKCIRPSKSGGVANDALTVSINGRGDTR